MGKIVFVVLLLMLYRITVCREIRRFADLSPYLRPPPVSRIKAIPLIKPPPQKIWSMKERPESKTLQTRSHHDYLFDDRKCDPCNSVPWIPIYGVGRHVKPLQPYKLPVQSYQPQLQPYRPQLQPHQPPLHVYQPPSHPYQPTSFAADSYYSSFNEMSSHLKPNLPLFPTFTPELTHNHIQDPFPAFTSTGIDNLQEPSLQHAQYGDHRVNNSIDWVYEPKAMPLSQYLWSVDYPLQIYETPLLDVPSGGANLPFHVQSQVYQPLKTVSPSPAPFNHLTLPSGEAINELSHTDDSKYSSSESKLSSIAAETNHLNDSFVENQTESLIDFLTPPSVTASDWVEVETETPKKKKQIQIVIPYMVNKSHTEKSVSQRFKDVWASFETTTPLPLVSYLKGNSSKTLGKIPVQSKRQEWSDMLRLQKAIDTWTVEGYSNHKQKPTDYYFQKVVTSTLSPSKEIPSDYLASTVSFVRTEPNTWYKPKMEEKMHKNSNERGKHNETSKPWEKLPVSVSPLTKEKVYIVTPLPLTALNFSADGVIENWP